MRDFNESERCVLMLCAMPSVCRAITGVQIARIEKDLGVSEKELTVQCLQKRLHGNNAVSAAVLQRINEADSLDFWLLTLENYGITVIPRNNISYPARLRNRLGNSAPPVLFCAGNTALLLKRSISLVGARNLSNSGYDFAVEAGLQIVKQGYVYCSGGARGADSVGFEQAIRHGDAVLFLPDSLKAAVRSQKYADALKSGHLLLVTEQGIDLNFNAARALSRNRLIHAVSDIVLVAESRPYTGGTWSGTTENLKHGWSEVFVYQDDSAESLNAGARALIERGAEPITIRHLSDISSLTIQQFFDC